MTQFQTRSSNGPETRTATVRLEHKALGKEGEFEGYGSVFGVRDSYNEVVARGAFGQSLSAHREAGTLPALLWQHDATRPIGNYSEMFEDDKGLYVKGQLALETQGGREAHALLKAGALNGLSIGFMPVRSEIMEDTDLRTLTEVDLWEVSLVTFPANGAARVSGTKALNRISDLTDWKSMERYLREEGSFSNDGATAMVAAVKRIRDGERDARDAKAAIQSSAARMQALLS